MCRKYNEIIRELRNEKGLTQKEIAEKLNISQRAYSHYEKGENEPGIEMLIKMAELYSVPVDVIVGRYEIAKTKRIKGE